MPSLEDLTTTAKLKAADLARAVAEAGGWAERCRGEVEDKWEKARGRIRAETDRKVEEARAQHIAALDGIQEKLARVTGGAGLGAAPWDDPRWATYEPATAPPNLTRFGQFTLAGTYTSITTPALLPFVSGRNLVLKAGGEAKVGAYRTAQAFVLRLLALVPPAKLKLLLLDPMGLGQNVAVFMRLKDYQADLVERAWVERADIERQLANLSEHIEMVIQTYLRGHYQTIEDYNKVANKIAEPYRLVVAMDFPVNFTEESAKRLVSIAANGPKCGVYTITMVDTGLELPYRFSLADLERQANVVTFTGAGPSWEGSGFNYQRLEADSPPPLPLFERLVDAVGEEAQTANRVELPFTDIELPEAGWWTGDASKGLAAPIGEYGPRRKQHFSLGEGEEQHALVAGRTGTGKSTLFHVLIMGLATAYAPDELELYLVDFKKGVEFTDYGRMNLPHARVVAVESEREFGLSVLEGLDRELTERAKIFRPLGLNNLREYRQLPEDNETRKTYGKLPRILLIVDEFQEFFTADDAVSRDAARYLDRLARQGRAFGIHVVLGSQTLAGAYSMTRATMDQMHVRIALSCSDADSRLILADDNPAARLLSRPGQAFYNADGGLKEGNVQFQIAWLGTEAKRQVLARVGVFAESRGIRLRKPIVFEGNVPARLEDNESHPLRQLLAAPDWPAPAAITRLWLGEPVAIKDPTSASLARRRGRNLLIAGRDEEQAAGLTASAILSLCAQYRRGEAEICLADLSAAASEDGSLFRDFCGALGPSVRVVSPRQLPEVVGNLADLAASRVKAEATKDPARFLVIFGLQRARNLRRDDQSWRRREGEPVSPADRFAQLLADGPEVGIHVLGWADGLSGLNLILDRKAMTEFGLRVALALPERESQDFLDTPLASKLPPYRALLYDDERVGLMEKFRPYDRPKSEWIDWLRARFASRESVGEGQARG